MGKVSSPLSLSPSSPPTSPSRSASSPHGRRDAPQPPPVPHGVAPGAHQFSRIHPIASRSLKLSSMSSSADGVKPSTAPHRTIPQPSAPSRSPAPPRDRPRPAVVARGCSAERGTRCRQPPACGLQLGFGVRGRDVPNTARLAVPSDSAPSGSRVPPQTSTWTRVTGVASGHSALCHAHTPLVALAAEHRTDTELQGT